MRKKVMNTFGGYNGYIFYCRNKELHNSYKMLVLSNQAGCVIY